MGDHGVAKSMLYSDFEAILDGMVGIPEFAGQSVRTAYCLVDGALMVRALVLFLIEFDEDGMADTSWNIPLRHLAEHAAPGPDMGAGPIRLACRSQCPVAWHQDNLWDPVMKSGANDFVFIRDTIRERGGKMGLHVEASGSFDGGRGAKDSPSPGRFTNAMDPNETASDIPVLAPTEDQTANAAATRVAKVEQDRERLTQKINELRLQIKTIETSSEEQVAQLRYAHQQKEEILSTQLEKVLMQFKNLKSQSTAMKQQNTALKAQVESLQKALEEQVSEIADKGSEIELITQQYREALAQRLEEEQGRWSEQLHAMEMELLDRDEKLGALQDELNDARHDHVKMANVGAEKLLEKLQALGLSFIAFHPGAGHIQVSAAEISQYMQNPLAFAARKCLVTEEHYQAWLKHYENPVCQVDTGGGRVCGKRVIRVEAPSQFKPGLSDRNINRCQHCQSEGALEAILRSR